MDLCLGKPPLDSISKIQNVCDHIVTKLCPKTSHNAFWDDIMYSNKGLLKSLKALSYQCIQVWRLAESNHGHMDFQSTALPTELRRPIL